MRASLAFKPTLPWPHPFPRAVTRRGFVRNDQSGRTFWVPMPLFLLDRDGVVVVNSSDNIKTPDQLRLLPGAADAIARLTRAGIDVAICTNQPEVGRKAMTIAELERVHEALRETLAAHGGRVEIYSCVSPHKCPRRKPAPGMLKDALRHYRADPRSTPFIGDQVDDLAAAFHAGCRRVLVKTGLGRKTLVEGLPTYVSPVEVFDDLAAAVDCELSRLTRPGRPPSR